MFIIKCPYCKSSKVKKNGILRGSQYYKCAECHKQFSLSTKLSNAKIWEAYLEGKQTIAELSVRFCVSESTIKRRLKQREHIWVQPSLIGKIGFVHIDATYWGHNWGVMLAIDEETGQVLYMAFIKHETIQAFIDAILAIVAAGYIIRWIIIDGKQELFTAFKDYPIQMCQFHMSQIVRRYLTLNPKMNASKELMQLCKTMTICTREAFESAYVAWKERWKGFLNKRTIHKDGKSYYLHRRIRTLVSSIDFYLPYLFTFQRTECRGMSNTNNKIEGTFTDLKRNLNDHSGLTIEHRRQFIIAYMNARQNGS